MQRADISNEEIIIGKSEHGLHASNQLTVGTKIDVLTTRTKQEQRPWVEQSPRPQPAPQVVGRDVDTSLLSKRPSAVFPAASQLNTWQRLHTMTIMKRLRTMAKR